MELIFEILVRIFEWAAPWTLKKIYPPKRIDDSIEVRVSPSGQGIELRGGDAPTAQVWLEIINMSPLHLKIDRAYGAFTYGSDVAEFVHLRVENLGPHQKISFPVHGSISPGHAEFIKRVSQSPNSNITEIRFEAHIRSDIHEFPIFRRLSTTHCRLINFGNAG